MEKTCANCHGSGIVQKTVEEISGTSPCDCVQIGTKPTKCYRCENIHKLGLYEECEQCYGTGKPRKK